MAGDQTDGGPAFPAPIDARSRDFTASPPGMSLRDWFAGQALIGLVHGAAAETFSMAGLLSAAEEQQRSIHEIVAGGAYTFADAMLAARAKGAE